MFVHKLRQDSRTWKELVVLVIQMSEKISGKIDREVNFKILGKEKIIFPCPKDVWTVTQYYAPSESGPLPLCVT